MSRFQLGKEFSQGKNGFLKLETKFISPWMKNIVFYAEGLGANLQKDGVPYEFLSAQKDQALICLCLKFEAISDDKFFRQTFELCLTPTIIGK